ncbi:MAG: DJ-1/PfpI family protein [Gammaproteobacteria bacterium]|nr:DJ-1/PfpI family protein [Gammaproteobacteria bacterium]
MKAFIMGVLLFSNFESLDVFGPVEMFGSLPERFKIIFIAEKKGLVKSAQNVLVKADFAFKNTPRLDILLIPGGIGTRKEVRNKNLLKWINATSNKTKLILSVCTGSALLAKAHILDYHHATSNKLAFDWVKLQGPNVQWIRKARWVEDGKIITSSGVAAGMDMSLYVIKKLYGEKISNEVIKNTEYIWNNNPNNDVFA